MLAEIDPAAGRVPKKVVDSQTGSSTEQSDLKGDCSRHRSHRPTESSKMKTLNPEKAIHKTCVRLGPRRQCLPHLRWSASRTQDFSRYGIQLQSKTQSPGTHLGWRHP